MSPGRHPRRTRAPISRPFAAPVGGWILACHDSVSRRTALAVLPLPPAELQQQFFGREVPFEAFLETGRRCAGALERALAAQSLTMAGFHRVLDFGCGCARVLRHFAPLFEGREFHGTDADTATIQWNRAHIPGVTFHQHAAEPPFPFTEREFDCVWSITAFSRLSEASAVRWLYHLQQVLRPGGIALISVHGLFRFSEDVARGCIRPEAARQFDTRGFTFVDAAGDPRLPDWYQHAFMTEDFARGLFCEHFDVLDYLARGIMDREDLLVLRRR